MNIYIEIYIHNITYSHIIIVKLNSCSYNYVGIRVRLGLQRVRGSEEGKKLGSGL